MIQVQHGVGIVAPALVHQTVNVDILAGHGGGKPAQRIGDILVKNGNSACGGSDAHIAVGEIH